MSNRLKRLEEKTGYRFRDAALLETALTHASHGDGRRRTPSNERMEFLGDRVLGLLVAEQLYGMFSGLSEGGLAHRLNALVNKGACARVARAWTCWSTAPASATRTSPRTSIPSAA